MAYIFMTDPDPGDEYVESTWEPDGGENAVILQPGEFKPIVDTTELTHGPTLQHKVIREERFVNRALGLKSGTRYYDTELAVEEIEVPENEETMGSRLFSEPYWLQNDETPADGEWAPIIQIDSAEEDFYINFGDIGVAYSFIRSDGRAATFLWQCC